MEFVKGTKEHNTQIVELLKITLGESLTKKSVELWNWKHNDNPFGASIIILAFDGDLLVGVRAFMCWEFMNKHTTIKCVRAVDTAVHPNYQGKGIFSKLTEAALETCKQEGTNIVFNTPNKISKIGYLKLGWVEAGKLSLRLLFPLKIPKNYNEHLINEALKNYKIKEIDFLNFRSSNNKFSTQLTPEYLNWRFVHCPINKYYCISKKDKYIIIFRVKKVKSFIEIRFCEAAIKNDDYSINEAISDIKQIIKIVKPAFLSCANNDNIPTSFFSKLFFLPNLMIGPVVTVKNVNYPSFESFKNFEIWQPSLGCMELF